MSFQMRQKLAMNVEWAWSQGQIKNKVDIESFAHQFYVKELLEKHPKAQYGHLNMGLEELMEDVRSILKILSYGGRRAKDVPAQRIAFLRAQL